MQSDLRDVQNNAKQFNGKLRLAIRIIKLKREDTELNKTNMQQYNKSHSYEKIIMV